MRTLLIDDDAICNFVTENILLDEAFSDEIISFQSASDALNFIKQGVPSNVREIIFLDLNMPQMDGWQFLEALAPFEKYLRDRCRIYILTSSITVSDRQKAKEYPMISGFIHKPISVEDLQSIRAAIEREA